MAAGDSWADPIIIGENATTATEVWEDFLAKKNDGSGKYMRFKNVNTSISGTGTQADPYQVSTYQEMLTATGAEYIYECKLINYDVESPTAIRTYMYKNNDIVKYCAFDPQPTTIDFNSISNNEYISNQAVSNHIDVNGWTWLNLKIYINGGQAGAMFTSNYTSNNDADISNLILLNTQAKTNVSNDGCYVFNIKMVDSIMQLDIDASGMGTNQILGFSYTDNYGCGLESCSVIFKTTSNNNCQFSPSYSGGSIPIKNSVVDFDVVCKTFGTRTSGNARFSVNRSVLKGKIKYSSISNYATFNVYDSIIDIDFDSTTNPSPPGGKSNSVFNKDKVNWQDSTGFVGVISSELLSPTTLQTKGLPIGVDT